MANLVEENTVENTTVGQKGKESKQVPTELNEQKSLRHPVLFVEYWDLLTARAYKSRTSTIVGGESRPSPKGKLQSWCLLTVRQKGGDTNGEGGVLKNEGSPGNKIAAEVWAKHVVSSRNSKCAMNRRMGEKTQSPRHLGKRKLM